MADIRIINGKAWLKESGYGVRLKIFGQAPNANPVFLGYTVPDKPGDGELGSGDFSGTPWYLPTNGIGTYKVWAEHEDNASVKSYEEGYYFDPDNYQGSGDPFDWNGNGSVNSELLVPGISFQISGRIHWIESTSYISKEDWAHLAVSTQNASDTTSTNYRTYIPDNTENDFYFDYNNQLFIFRSNIGTTTFYVFFRDHNGDCTEIRQITASNGSSVSVSDITCP
ncbi:MAG: hypothetical protein V1799_17035 [bacterium]